MTTVEAEGEPYSCPWCPVVIEDDGSLVTVALVQYERHLDGHMAMGVGQVAS